MPSADVIVIVGTKTGEPLLRRIWLKSIPGSVGSEAIPSTLARPGAAGFWLAVILRGIGAGVAAPLLTQLLGLVQHTVWGGTGTDLLNAAQHANALRHILVLLGAGLLIGAGQMVLGYLSSSNGIEITAAIWFHAGRLPTLRTLGSALLSVLIVGMGCH